MRTGITLFLSIALTLCLTGCGKYGRPEPPEAFAPAAVQSLEVSADTSGVNFKWKSPERDVKGRELRTMDGYRIYRKELQEKGDLLNEDVEYEILSTTPDIHVAELKRLREEAREAGQITRKVKVDEALKKFEVSDKTVSPGRMYAYRVIPFNQGDTEGRAGKIVRVLYRGDSSEIVMINESNFEEEIEEAFVE